MNKLKLKKYFVALNNFIINYHKLTEVLSKRFNKIDLATAEINPKTSDRMKLPSWLYWPTVGGFKPMTSLSRNNLHHHLCDKQ